MKKRRAIVLFGLWVFALPMISCVKKAPLQKSPVTSETHADTAADAALLSEESEIRKELRRLEEKQSSERALEEQQDKELRDAERRAHRAITEDQILTRTTT